MKKIIFRFGLCVWLFFGLSISAAAADNTPYPCQTPTERATKTINKFLRGAEIYIESETQRELAASSAIAMNEDRNYSECEKLLQKTRDIITYKRKSGDAKGAYFWDVSFFKVGNGHYAVVMIETPNTDKEHSELTPLDKAWPGQEMMVELYNSEFERLGLYTPSGFSRRYDNKVILRKEDEELRE